MSLQSLIDKAKFDYVNSDINETNFPPQLASGPVELMELPEYMTGEKLVEYIESKGYVPATPEQLVQFSIYHWDEVKKFYGVLALGSRWQDCDGNVYVPCADQGGGGRRLYLARFGCKFGSDWRVLVSRKLPTSTYTMGVPKEETPWQFCPHCGHSLTK